MATSFGDGGNRPDVRRILTNPWVLGGAAVALVIGLFMWRRTAGAGTPVQSQQYGLQPGSTAAGLSTDQMGLQIGGLQGDIGNLATQVSTGIAGIQSQIQPSQYVTRGGNTYFTVPGTESQSQAAADIAGVFGGRQSDVVGRLQFFDPTGPTGGRWWYPTNVPGYQTGDLPRWQQLVVQ